MDRINDHKLSSVILLLGRGKYLIRSLGLLIYQPKTILSKKQKKMTKQIALEKLSKSWRAKEIFKIAKNWAFSNIKPKYFVIFFVFTQNVFFLNYKLSFVLSKKIDQLWYKYGQNYGHLWGGGEANFIWNLTPPQKKKINFRFRQHCRKTNHQIPAYIGLCRMLEKALVNVFMCIRRKNIQVKSQLIFFCFVFVNISRFFFSLENMFIRNVLLWNNRFFFLNVKTDSKVEFFPK